MPTNRQAARARPRGVAAPARRSPASGRTKDAVALLRADHQEVSALFARYDKAKGGKADLAHRICAALTVHARIEEEIFYPACRRKVDGAGDLLAEAKVEHQSLKELIAKIEGGRPGTAEYDAQVKVLGEYVKHHVKEEHEELFPKVRKSDLDLKELGARLAERKAELA